MPAKFSLPAKGELTVKASDRFVFSFGGHPGVGPAPVLKYCLEKLGLLVKIMNLIKPY